MQLRMWRIIQSPPRLTRRRYDTCAIRLVAPASIEPYIQYRAWKRENLQQAQYANNIYLVWFWKFDMRSAGEWMHRNARTDYARQRTLKHRSMINIKKRACQCEYAHENASYVHDSTKWAWIRVFICHETTSAEKRVSAKGNSIAAFNPLLW